MTPTTVRENKSVLFEKLHETILKERDRQKKSYLKRKINF